MYFLNGSRIYLKPLSGNASLESQLQSCLTQLSEINSRKKIYKLNFFVSVNSHDEHREFQVLLKKEVSEKINGSVILNFIAQPPLTCKILVEAFYYDPGKWEAGFQKYTSGEAVLFRRANTKFLIGHVQCGEPATREKQSEEVFSGINEIFNSNNFETSSIIRQWNYIEDIVGSEGGRQNYQQFNNARSAFYGGAFKLSGYPAATGIGMDRGGVIVEFIALDSDEAVTKPVNNPKQVAAHSYSGQVLAGGCNSLKTTPKFERARYLELFDKKAVFISGTASIIGEKTSGIGNPVEQTKITIQNIQRLYSDEVLSLVSSNKLEPKYGHARVYIKNRKDFNTIRRVFKMHYGDLPVVYIIADICRDELLVEIEGEVVFNSMPEL